MTISGPSINNRLLQQVTSPTSKLLMLQKQMNHELFASQSYLGMAAWASGNHFPGLGEFLRQQSLEEREHAMRLLDYLLDRGEMPQLTATPPPRMEFESLLDLAEYALELERENTRGVHAAYRAAIQEEDFATQVTLQWFISEQVEEERWADEMVSQIRLAGCAGAMTRLDSHFGKRLRLAQELREEGTK